MEKAPICKNCKKEYPSCGILAIIPGMNVCSEHEPKGKLPSELLREAGLLKSPIRIVKVENLKDRVETGAVQFNDDWPGLFIRGDNAFWYAMQLELIKDCIENKTEPHPLMTMPSLDSLIELLKSTNLNNERKES
jgi:hypothetical protein